MKFGTVMPLLDAPDNDPLNTRINKAADLGLTVLGVFLRPEMRDENLLHSARDLAAQKGVELRLGTGGNFYLEGDEGKQEVERVADALRFANKHLGITFSSLAPGPMLTTHRWSPGKPLEERKEILAKNLGALADAVKDAGISLGVENHCDWRGHEVRDYITKANRSNLKVQLDTGNPFSVFEEPVDCAEVLAPLTISVHLKDMHVTPFASGDCKGTRAVAVPLGEGHVDNVKICQILQDKSPDPANLALMIEPFYLPEGVDREEFLKTSVEWGKKHLAKFITS